MNVQWRAGIVFVLVLGGCAAGPTATQAPTQTPTITEPRLTTPPATETPEPTPTATEPGGSGLPLSDGNGWPVDVSADISGTTNGSDGSYSGTGAARWCGDNLINLTGNVRAFGFEFPLDDAAGNIGDVTFSADDLVPGESTTVFYISVNVLKNAPGFDPAATVISAGETGTAVSGTGSAQLTVDGSTRTLELQATSNYGETIKLKGVCSAP